MILFPAATGGQFDAVRIGAAAATVLISLWTRNTTLTIFGGAAALFALHFLLIRRRSTAPGFMMPSGSSAILDRAHGRQLGRVAVTFQIAGFQPADAMFGADRPAHPVHQVMHAGLDRVALVRMVGTGAPAPGNTL